ncbi:MAG: hypothetical protein AAB726_03530 [Patescibacteria group bacterium]
MDNQNAGPQGQQFNPINPIVPEYKAPETKKDSGGLGPIIGLIVIIGIILIGGIYYFYKTVNTDSGADRAAEENAQQKQNAEQNTLSEEQNIQMELDGLKDNSIEEIGGDIF